MNAWRVTYKGNWGDDYEIYVHAETRGKAKSKARQIDPGTAYRFDIDWVDIRAYREPGMDGEPFTYENFSKAGIYFWWEGEEITSLTTDCNCEICKTAKGTT